MPARVSTGDRDAVLRQIRWCAAVQTLVNCHCQLVENPVGNVEPMQIVVQYLGCRGMKKIPDTLPDPPPGSHHRFSPGWDMVVTSQNLRLQNYRHSVGMT